MTVWSARSMNGKQKRSYRDVFGYLLIGLSVIMLGKSLMLCFSNDIWYDELFTVGMIEHSYGELIAFTARDVHPPLYYCIVKVVVELCKLMAPSADTVIIAKTVSVLPYFILLLYSVTFIRKRFGIFTGGLFLFCVISMPQLSAYTVEVRMYGWALLFVTAAFLHAYGVITDITETKEKNAINPTADGSPHKLIANCKTRRHAIALVFYGLAAAYTQYFACVAVIMIYLCVLVVYLIHDRQKIKQWLVCAAISITGYAPWLYTLYTQITAVGENYWILPLSWRTLGGCVKFLMKPAFANNVLSIILAIVLFGVCVLIFMWNVAKLCHNRREKDNRTDNISDANVDIGKHISDYNKYRIGQWNDFGFVAAGVGVLAGLVLFGFAASILFRPIFVYRYMIPALGCFWLSFAVGLGIIAENTRQEAGRPSAVFLLVKRKMIGRTIHADKIYKGIVIAVSALVLLIGLRDYRAFMGEEEYKILLMKDTTAALKELGSEDILIFNFDQVQMVTGYYLNNDSFLWYGQPETLIQDICGHKNTLNEDVDMIKEWLIQDRKVRFIGSFNSREDIVKELRAAGITVDETGSYLLERYWFNVYELRMGK